MPFLLTTVALIYNHVLFLQKLQTVREDVSIPTSEQNVYIGRTRFLSTAIQNSHYKILTYISENQKDLLESEIVTMEGLTELRLEELQKLRSSIEQNKAESTPPRLLLQRLETEIENLDAKHHSFLEEVKSGQSKKIMTLPAAKLTEEWDHSHNLVLDTATAFLIHNQKEVEESRELADVIKQDSLQWMYLILIVNIGLLFISIASADYLVLESMEKIKCYPLN